MLFTSKGRREGEREGGREGGVDVRNEETWRGIQRQWGGLTLEKGQRHLPTPSDCRPGSQSIQLKD